ncbi:MAG TPA: ankyrin repeat domain-containing protein [Burkholderiaceae bacterium]
MFALLAAGMAGAASADDSACRSDAERHLSKVADGRSMRELRKFLLGLEKQAISASCEIEVLKRAFGTNDYDTASLLLRDSPQLDADTRKKLIVSAVKWGDPALLQLALVHAKGEAADFGKGNVNEATPLDIAVARGNTILLDILLRADGANYSESAAQFGTAVEHAACTHQNDALDMLLASKFHGQGEVSKDDALPNILADDPDRLSDQYCPGQEKKEMAKHEAKSDCASAKNARRKGKMQYTDCHQTPLLLESNNPNLLGYSREKGEQNYIDIVLSLRYPLFFDVLRESKYNNWFPYFGFDMHGAFYLRERPSSPVIIRAFNPSLHLRRYEPGQQAEVARDDPFANYLDVAYGHLSDGQIIDTWAALKQQAASIKAGQNANLSDEQAYDYARDYISRSWNYTEASWHFADRNQIAQDDTHNKLAFTASLRYYFGGFLGSVEEFNPEVDNPRAITKLSQVSGLSFSIYDQFPKSAWLPHDANLNLSTGLSNPGKWNSAKLSITSQPLPIFNVPLTAWASNGYVNTLAQYYRRQTAMGLAVSFDTE